MTTLSPQGGIPPVDQVAGNGLLDRRALLGRGIAIAGAAATGGASLTSAAAGPPKAAPCSLVQGTTIHALQSPSRSHNAVVRPRPIPTGPGGNSPKPGTNRGCGEADLPLPPTSCPKLRSCSSLSRPSRKARA